LGFDDPLKCRDDRFMIDNLAVLKGLLAFLYSREELLFIGDIGPQRLVHEPRFAAPGCRKLRVAREWLRYHEHAHSSGAE
jgi:hypothetical protein